MDPTRCLQDTLRLEGPTVKGSTVQPMNIAAVAYEHQSKSGRLNKREATSWRAPGNLTQQSSHRQKPRKLSRAGNNLCMRVVDLSPTTRMASARLRRCCWSHPEGRTRQCSCRWWPPARPRGWPPPLRQSRRCGRCVAQAVAEDVIGDHIQLLLLLTLWTEQPPKSKQVSSL